MCIGHLKQCGWLAVFLGRLQPVALQTDAHTISPEWIVTLAVLCAEGLLEHTVALICLHHQLENSRIRVLSSQMQKSILCGTEHTPSEKEIFLYHPILVAMVRHQLLQKLHTLSVSVTVSISLVNSAFPSRLCASAISMPIPRCSTFVSSSVAMLKSDGKLGCNNLEVEIVSLLNETGGLSTVL